MPCVDVLDGGIPNRSENTRRLRGVEVSMYRRQKCNKCPAGAKDISKWRSIRARRYSDQAHLK